MSTNVRSANDFVLSWVHPRLSASSDGRQSITAVSLTFPLRRQLLAPAWSALVNQCSIRLRVSEIGLRPDVDLTADWEERRSTAQSDLPETQFYWSMVREARHMEQCQACSASGS